MFEDSFPAFKMTLLIVSTIFVIGLGSFAMRCVQNTYDGVEITTNSEEIYAECEKGESYQAIVKIATHKKNGKKLYFLENVADKPVSKAVKE